MIRAPESVCMDESPKQLIEETQPQESADEHYPKAKRIALVMDNYNTHGASAHYLFIPASSLGIGFLQWHLKFCVGFGSKGVFNFGAIGKTFQVEQEENVKKDLKKARQKIWAGIGFGMFCAILFYLV